MSFDDEQPLILQLQLFVQKRTVRGSTYERTDVTLSSKDNDKETVHIKFWNETGELLSTVMMDQMIVLYAVLTTMYNDKMELVSTDETTIEVSKIYLLAYWVALWHRHCRPIWPMTLNVPTKDGCKIF